MSKLNVFNVASYILQKKGEITTMKLQKLVYYCQAWSLAWDDVPLFDERIEAWANGPVCPDLFNMHRGKFVATAEMFSKYSDFDLTESQKETIDNVLEYYGDRDPVWLSNLTHKENPWRLARANVPSGERCSNEITKESMQEYYGGL